MRDRPTRQHRSLLAITVVVGLLLVVVVSALTAEGRPGTATHSNDGGAWLINRDAGAIGHMNRQVLEVSGAIRVAPPGADFDVHQSRDLILVHDRSTTRLLVIDSRTEQQRGELLLPDQTEVIAVDGGAVIHRPTPFTVWLLTDQQLLDNTELNGIEPLHRGQGTGLVAVAADGALLINDAAQRTLNRPVTSLDREIDQLSAAGTTTLAAHGDELLAFDGSGISAFRLSPTTDDPPGAPEDASRSAVGPTAGPALVLTQPSSDPTMTAAITSDGTVWTIELDTGEVHEGPRLPGHSPVPPILHRGCLFTVTTSPPTFAKLCPQASPTGDNPTHLVATEQLTLDGAGLELRLRLVNDWVWINDLTSGGAWVANADTTLARIDDWGVALSTFGADDARAVTEERGGREKVLSDPDAVDAEIRRADERDEDGENDPPVARGDHAGTRVDRPLIVRVLANDEDPDGDVLLVEDITDISGNGRGAAVWVTPDQAAVQVSPPAGFVGTISFRYRISDGRGGTAEAPVTVTVEDYDDNRPPEPVADFATARRGASTALNVLANDTDPDGDPLLLVGMSETNAGTLVHDSSGRIVFTPHLSASDPGRLEFTYLVADPHGATAEGRLVIAIRLADANSPPDARNDSAVTSVGTPTRFNVLDNDTDPDGDPLIVARGNDHLDAGGDFTFTPDRPGTHLFDYVVSDGRATDRAVIRVEVAEAARNHPPVAVRDDVTIARDESALVRVLDNDGDPDGDVVGIVEWSAADGIDVEEVPGVGFRVGVHPDAPSEVSFRYGISDGRSEPVSTAVVVTVADIETRNQPPIARDDSAEVRSGRTTVIDVLHNDLDPERGSLRVVKVSSGPGVTATVGPDGGSISVEVAPDVTGEVILGYDVVDEHGARAAAIVDVRVLPPGEPNRPPVAHLDVARTIVGRWVDAVVLGNDSDPDGDALALESVATQPAHGTAEILADGIIRYSPADGFTGTDRFAYVVVDTEDARSIGEVLVGVIAPNANRPPTARDDAFSLTAAGRLDVLANDSDPDGDALTIVSHTDPHRGTVTLDGDVLVYTPAGVGAGSVTFSYVISDGFGHQDDALVVLDLTADKEPVPPVAVDDRVGPTRPGQRVVVDVLANDADPDGESAALRVTSSDPAVSVNGSTLTVIAGRRSSQHRYTVTDADGLTATATLTVFVVDNAAPSAVGARAETRAGTPVEIDVAAHVSDPDGDDLSFTCCDHTTGGSTEILPSSTDGLMIRFRPDDGFAGEGGFSYLVDDQAGHLVSGWVRVTVLPADNRPPTAVDTRIEVEAGSSTPLAVTSLGDDPDPGDAITINLLDQPGSGIGSTVSGEHVLITAPISGAGAVGTLTFRATDRGGATAEGRVTIVITPVRAPLPRAVADSARTFQETPISIDILANDLDPLGQGLRITAVGDLRGGTVTGAGGAGNPVERPGPVTFHPAAGFFGTAGFSYAVTDATAAGDRTTTGQVTIDVVGRPATPAPPLSGADNARATLTWTTPVDNGAPIDDYRVEVHSAGGESRTVPTGDTNILQLNGLTNGDEYEFRIQAHNQAGWSEWSPWSVPVRPDTRPQAPAAPSLAYGDTQLALTWSLPVNDGSAITGYRLELGGGDNQVVDVGAVTTYTWRNLTNGIEYRFRVAAVNGAGASSWSSWSRVEHPLREPDAPTAPIVTRGDQALGVTWDAPADNGDRIIAYELEIQSTGRVVTVTGASTTNYRWSDLGNGVAQSFRVRAANRDPDPGPWSDWSTPVTPCGVPDAVATPGASRGDKQASINWGAPDDRGCPVTGYQIEAASIGGSLTQRSSGTSHDFTGLANGTGYAFRVRASNSEGFGPWSAPSATVVPAGPPTAPTVTTGGATAPGTIVISWSGATANGTPITGYQRSINGGSAADAGAGNGQTVGGLAEGTSYDIRIRACNSVGCSAWGPTATISTWGRPSAPLQVAATAGNATWSFSWSLPAGDGGTPVTAFEYRINGGITRDVLIGVRSVTVQPAANGTTYTGEVRACNAIGCGPWASAAATPMAPPPTVSASIGAVYSGPNPCSGNCRWVQLTAANLAPNTTVQVTCHDSRDGLFKTVAYTSTAAGALSATPCYYGYSGDTVWLAVNGIESNRIIWP